MPENTEKRQNACPAWIWLVLLLGLALLYFLFQQATTKKANWIQEDIQSRVTQNLQNTSGLSQVVALTDGRDVTLTGEVSNQEELSKAEQIAKQTYGARLVINQLNIGDVLSPATEPVVELQPNESISEANEISSETTPTLEAKIEPMPEEFPPLEEELAEKAEADNPAAETEEPTVSQAAIIEEKLSQLDFSSITFEKNSSALTDNAKNTLNDAAKTLLEHPNVNIRIEGHTDTSGNPEINLKLSKQRAQSVLNYFVDAGIENSRLEADGFGDQFPIAPNDTKAGRIKNRRIEIKVKNGE